MKPTHKQSASTTMNLASISLRILPRKLPLVLWGLAALASRAHAQTAPTVITTVPYTISKSGSYVLGQGVSGTSITTPAITIATNNVILDLSGYYVSGAANPASTNAVISVGNVQNVIIRNGLVANDGYGILFTSSNSPYSNYQVYNMTFTRCYIAGLYSQANIAGGLVRDCMFTDLSGSTSSTNVSSYGIYTLGGWRIENNTINTVTATGSGQSIGINASTGDFALGNTVSNCYIGINGAKYLNNLTSGCSIPFQSGINASGNN